MREGERRTGERVMETERYLGGFSNAIVLMC